MTKETELRISHTLKGLGIKPGVLGYGYLRHAIGIAIESPKVVHNMTTIVYPEVAKLFDTTPSRAERCMRGAIEAAWLHGDVELQLEIFGYTVRAHKYKPTNHEFISTVADYLRLTHGLEGEHHGT